MDKPKASDAIRLNEKAVIAALNAAAKHKGINNHNHRTTQMNALELYTSIANEFSTKLAQLFTPVAKADVVVQVPPIWCRAKTAEVLLGIKRDILNKWVAERKVVAKKGDKIVLYKFADIVSAIEALPNKEFK